MQANPAPNEYAQLVAHTTSLQKQLDGLKAKLAEVQIAPSPKAPKLSVETPTQGTSRRGLLKLAGVTAVAAAAGALGAATLPGTVSATDNSALIVGQDNTANVQTSLASNPSSTAATLLRVDNSTTSNMGNNTAISALMGIGDAILGVTVVGAGVHGKALGSGVGAAGLLGEAGTGIGAILSGGHAPLLLSPAWRVGHPVENSHSAGEIYTDNQANIWVCTVSGTPGVWVQLNTAGAVKGAQVLLANVRIVNSVSFANNQVTTLQIGNGAGGDVRIPTTAQGVLASISVSSNVGSAWKLWAADQPEPAGALIFPQAAGTFFVAVLPVQLSRVGSSVGSGKINVRAVGLATGVTGHFYLDVLGYIA